MVTTGPFTALALFVATLYAFQNLLRYLRAKDANGAIGILLAVVAGVGVVALAAHSDVSAGLRLIQNGAVLGKLNMGSQVMLGIAVGSSGTVLADLRKAFDNNDNAAKPPIAGTTPPPE